MANELKIFENEQFGQVRVVMHDGEPWFVGKDVLQALGYPIQGGTSRLFGAVPDVWKGGKQIATLGGTQNLICLSEQGLYFFLGRSDKKAALPYQMWLAGEVVPSIRKTGGYIAGQEQMTDAELMAKAVLVAQNTIAEREKRIASMKITIESQQTRIVEMTPKAEYCDTVLDTQGLINIEDIAKLFGKNARWLNAWLHEMGVQYKRNNKGPWKLYDKYAKLGYARTNTWARDYGYYVACNEHLKWTHKGKKFICDLLIANGFKPIMPLDE